MKPKWEPKTIEAIPETITEKAYRNRIARVAEILYIELSQLEKDPEPTSATTEPKRLRATSDQVA